jgi:hypothetical protein
MAAGIHLTESQVRQLVEFYEEHGHGREGDKSILILEAPTLGTGYYEVVTLDMDGEPTTDKRVLFPT